MSHLIALVFDDQFKGEEARAALHCMAGEGVLEMNDTGSLPGRRSRQSSRPPRASELAELEHDEFNEWDS
jgi:hypothetical protein